MKKGKSGAFKMYVDENDNITTVGINSGHFLASVIRQFLKENGSGKWVQLKNGKDITMPENRKTDK